jgi:hypothetical protein
MKRVELKREARAGVAAVATFLLGGWPMLSPPTQKRVPRAPGSRPFLNVF